MLLLTESLAGGGAERQLTLLARHLQRRWRPTVAAFGAGPFTAELEAAGIPVSVFTRRHRYDFSAFARLWALLAKERPAVVHSFGWLTSAAVLPACRATGIPFVNGGIRMGMVEPRHQVSARLMLQYSDAVVANSHAGLRAYGVPPERGVVIYNGFDSNRLARWQSRLRSGRRSPRFTVLMAGRMVPGKDFDTLFSAARMLEQREPGRWLFVALGDGPDRQTYVDTTGDLQKSGCVVFPTPSYEIIEEIASADACVLLASPNMHQEGCSNAILEYMACGKPIICTDAGGNAEVVTHRRTGLLVPPHDTHGLVARLQEVRQDDALSKALGREAREVVRTKFSPERMAGRYAALYEGLLKT